MFAFSFSTTTQDPSGLDYACNKKRKEIEFPQYTEVTQRFVNPKLGPERGNLTESTVQCCIARSSRAARIFKTQRCGCDGRFICNASSLPPTSPSIGGARSRSANRDDDDEQRQRQPIECGPLDGRIDERKESVRVICSSQKAKHIR